MKPIRRCNSGPRLLRKYENLKHRLQAMLADGSFHLLEACRRMELLRKLSRRLHALNRLFLRVGLSTAALAGGFLLLATAAQGATGFVPQQNRFPFGNDNPLRFVVSPGYIRACFGDFNGDGDLDTLVGLDDGTTNYYENRGTLRHADMRSTSDILPGTVAASGDAMPFAADLDGDGDLDVVIGQADGTLAYFENTGTATAPDFLERVGVDNPFDGIDVGDGSCPCLADLDGDGDLDLLIGAGGIIVPFYFENTGSRTAPAFVERTGTGSPFTDGDVLSFPTPVAADLDDDGDLDLVAGDAYGNVFLFENIGTRKKPAFALRTGTDNPFDGVGVPGGLARPALADLDNDGDVDAMIASADGRVFAFENIGTPANADFTERVTFDDVASPAFADLDGDGDLDLVVGLLYGAFSYYENTGTADAPAFVHRPGPASPLDGISVTFFAAPTFADLDDDGDLDLLVGDLASLTPRYFENTGDAASPSFTERIGAANPFDGFAIGYSLRPTLVDIDGDGDIDCFVGEKYSTIHFFENTGTAAIPAFVERLDGDNPLNGILPATSYVPTPTFVDFDGDGDFDCPIGVMDYYSATILYAENDGDATNPSFTLAVGGNNPFAAGVSGMAFLRPAVVDIDADGQPEAFVGDKYSAIKHYVLSEQVANGSGFAIMAAEVENLGVPLTEFTKKPTVTSGYFDPVKDLNKTKAKTAKPTVLTKIAAAAPPDTVDCEWKSKIRLIDAKALKAAYKQGDSARDVLDRTPQAPLTMALAVSTVDGDGTAFTDDNVKRISVMPPTIVSVVSLSSFETVRDTSAGDVLAIRGLHFGTKAKAWMEYVDAKGVTKALNLKTIGTKPYPNAKGDTGKGIMDPGSGDSLLVVQVPAKWPKDWNHGVNHNLVLDNGIGIATFNFGSNP
jgi:hypothetical protein